MFSEEIDRLDQPADPDTLHPQALLAQLAEQLTLNQRVVGSSPTQGTFPHTMTRCVIRGHIVFNFPYILDLRC